MEKIQFNHYPVLKDEAIEALRIKPDGIYCDLTLGGGSDALEIVKRLDGNGKLIAVDRDTDAINHSKEKLKDYKDKIHFVHDNYVNIANIVKDLGYEKISGALIDLGISTYQIEADRGFSYVKDSQLDMRMDRSQKLTAADVVNYFSKQELTNMLYKYGEEKYTNFIVGAIIKKRGEKFIGTTLELAEIIKNAVKAVNYKGGHPAKRTFQAIRIFVNREIENIEPTLDSVENLLESGGRLAVISFHSIEDRTVKQCFAKYEKSCVCDPRLPVCVCGKKSTAKIITKKPVYPSMKEIEENGSRSENAKLRVMQKL